MPGLPEYKAGVPFNHHVQYYGRKKELYDVFDVNINSDCIFKEMVGQDWI
jgi:hypothetical protein